MIGKEPANLEDLPEPDLMEYKAIPVRRRNKRSGTAEKMTDDPYLKSLRWTFSSPYSVALIDDIEAFVIMPNPSDGTRSVGFSAKIPGVPSLMKISFEKMFVQRSRVSA